MGLYNLLHGENADADVLLAGLGLTRGQVGRYRDVWVTAADEIAVYTRNGGGNRDCWSDEPSSNSDSCDCAGCVISYRLPQHPLYLRDEDDDFDSTYATVYFKAPDSVPADYPRGESGDARWAKTIAALGETGRPPS